MIMMMINIHFYQIGLLGLKRVRDYMKVLTLEFVRTETKTSQRYESSCEVVRYSSLDESYIYDILD
jgi:hypothetical protein